MIKVHTDLYKILYYTILLMQVMYLPQTPLAAPGPTLLEQIIYPHPLTEAAHLDHAALESILHKVKLQHLLQRAQGLWTLPLDWTGTLLGPLNAVAMAVCTLDSALHHRLATQKVSKGLLIVNSSVGLDRYATWTTRFRTKLPKDPLLHRPKKLLVRLAGL